MLIIAFLGGLLTVLSPCILPIVPFVFARAGRSRTSLVLTLGGLVLTFAAVSSLAVVGSDWVVKANIGGRYFALAVMLLFALSLLAPRLGTWLARPFVALGNRLAPNATASGPLAALLIGVATGLLWAPCAGPILGLILSGALLAGPNAQTSLLLLAYGLGSAVSLGTLIIAGKGLSNRLRLSLPVVEWLRRASGVLVLLAAVGIASGGTRELLAGTSSQLSNRLEQQVLKSVSAVIDRLVAKAQAASEPDLTPKGGMPSLGGAVQWLNSPPLSREDLRGKVVLVDFWTFDCINCQHTLPYVKQWAERYGKDGLVVIGVHTPEYPFERVPANVRKQVERLGITYPVAIDNDYAIWRNFANQYWPAHYLIDADGQVRYSHFGEGAYAIQENVIRKLLAEAKAAR
ncbi:cytochrome c biogenesis protein DipZ [Pseudomonas sp. zfem002]|uniref:cytochrome c biogenesis protein DipZ n=1 Tax=Pseudomonas sp. zfem002 TaxID=3078197 RepID=UPI00292A11D1|nr:cytochrome c biogenesis protein DipZ [Pseudomonas sp. zfem002]MDU9393893.1 cytochrome c biogenesis protein DipZ [Pseudomonas sp. zfem002]